MNIYDKAFLSRILATIIFLYLFSKHSLNYNFLLPFFLNGLDGIDSSIAPSTHTFAYKIYDKIADTLSYFLVTVFFPVDKEYLYFLMYRVAGVLAFGMSRKLYWLVIFPDMMKEYLLYKSVFSDMSAFPVFIPVKVAYELWHHFHQDTMIE
jgi:hypothetical protein